MKTLTNDLLSNRMKSLMAALFVMIFAASCGEEDPVLGDDETLNFEVDEANAETEATIESAMDDIDNITEAGMDFANVAGRHRDSELLECAEVTHDEENQTITIDYGDGCEGRRGRMRSGKIIITYTGRSLEPGSVKTVTMEDFMVDEVAIAGTRIKTNLMMTEDDTPVFRIQLVGGSATFPDGTVATRESDLTRTWIRGEDELSDESYVEGTSSGLNREGNTYETTILERIVYKRDCGRLLKFLPVSGVKEIVINGGESVITYDYGDGECDNLVTINTDGVSEEVEINPRRLKHIAKRG
ncbi:MAG: hypothetical protein RJQ09_00195 [Cyclobacteriaceae bacterium]